MDFFESQADAKRKTTLLTLYFVLAVAFIICGVYVAVLLALYWAGEVIHTLWIPSLFYSVAVGVVTVVAIGSLYKIIVLSQGGTKVAEMMGARPVLPNTTDLDERKLLNVVEEMAIASGVPVPRVYVMPEEMKINAFAAGLNQGDSVVAVTRGSIEQLSREELQGVVAHEFSHILNGDMRLNLRLIGLINGILVIAMIGRAIIRGLSSGRSRSSGKKGGGGMPVLVLGLLLLLVGYIGMFFGKLIKSAVSRQREFLADASAVQFTRNPLGILGALKKIAGLEDGSKIQAVRAEEASHLFFGNGVKESFLRVLSTHPPIEERIRRIDPTMKVLPAARRADQMEADALSAAGFWAGERVELSPEQVVSSVGSPGPEHIIYAERLLADLPSLVTEAAREPFGARALVYGFLLSRGEGSRSAQLESLKEHANPAVLRELKILMPVLDTVGQGYRLPLMDMTVPVLKSLSAEQYRRFRQNVKRLVEADREISLFEFALQYVLLRPLETQFERRKPPAVKYKVLDQIQVEAMELLSVLAWEGCTESIQAEEAFRKGVGALGDGKVRMSLLPREKCSLKMLEVSLGRLAEASFQIRKALLKACELCIGVDGRVSLQEAELLRAVASSLDCPVPPIFPSQADS